MRICISIREPTTSEAAAAARRAAVWADLIELRADFIRDLDLERLFAGKTRPIIFTMRPKSEGGVFEGGEQERLETLIAAGRLGADYIDVEFSSSWQAVLGAVPRERVILSHHDFARTPPGLPALVDSMAVAGAGVLKLAVRANRLSDNLAILGALKHAGARGVPLCALAMGREGVPSRILGPLWGSWMTFASLPGGEATADGQLPADRMADEYRIRSIGAETKVFGVTGKPLGHSLSPCVHNAAFAARGMDAVYLPLEAPGLGDLLEFSAAVPLEGVSVTIPHKEEAHSLAHSLSVEAGQTGAVNTWVRKAEGWHGENTDVEGFLRPLRRRMRVGGMRCVVLGAGGAARAVVCALRLQGAAVAVAARRAEKAREIASRFGAEALSWEMLADAEWDLLVNSTPLGMCPHEGESPLPAERLTGRWVYDLVYNPRETRLLKMAAARGCGVISGEEMFLGQAMKQQQLWCGSPPSEEAMRSALNAALDQAGAGTRGEV